MESRVGEILSQTTHEDGKLPPAKSTAVGVEIHFHISGPLIVGSELAKILLPMLMQVTGAPTTPQPGP